MYLEATVKYTASEAAAFNDLSSALMSKLVELGGEGVDLSITNGHCSVNNDYSTATMTTIVSPDGSIKLHIQITIDPTVTKTIIDSYSAVILWALSFPIEHVREAVRKLS